MAKDVLKAILKPIVLPELSCAIFDSCEYGNGLFTTFMVLSAFPDVLLRKGRLFTIFYATITGHYFKIALLTVLIAKGAV